MMSQQQLYDIERLESIRHCFRASNYRLILAEALVNLFVTQVDSPSAIRKHTNKVLTACGVQEISLGFVRNILES